MTNLVFFNPSLMMFFGVAEDEGRKQLIPHVSQNSLLLVTLHKLNPDEPKRPLEFEQGVPSTNNANPLVG